MARSLVAPHPRRIGRRSAQPVLGALRPLTAAASLTLAGVGFARRRRRLRRGLIAALVALGLLCGGWLWLRDSPLVAVERVRIARRPRGRRGSDRRGAEPCGAAHDTLDVNVGALRAAVAQFRVVRDLRVATGFPHALRIDVIEQLPVAAVVVGGARTAVAADGAVLGPGLLSSSLATIDASSGPLRSGHIRSATVLAELRVLGAAPARTRGLGRAGVHRPRRDHGGDAQRPVDLLRRRRPSARQVAVRRPRARRPDIGGRDLRRRAPARTSRRRHQRAGGPAGGDHPGPGERVGSLDRRARLGAGRGGRRRPRNRPRAPPAPAPNQRRARPAPSQEPAASTAGGSQESSVASSAGRPAKNHQPLLQVDCRREAISRAVVESPGICKRSCKSCRVR